MSEITDAAVIEALRRQMAQAAARQLVAASNLANLNTPGYRARELEFSNVLDRELTGRLGLTTTTPNHLAGDEQAPGAPATTEAATPARRDGNTVQLDRELLTMTKAAGEFARAQTALAAKFRLVRYAINEGR
ncbi:MAG: flagellar basal body rod protein FlgB [Acidobacteria bacterium]|nr:flagellar basal body rod protein FlgB [Acidobacteriota bacterium]